MFGFGKKGPKGLAKSILVLEQLESMKTQNIETLARTPANIKRSKDIIKEVLKLLPAQIAEVKRLRKNLGNEIVIDEASLKTIGNLIENETLRASDEIKRFMQEMVAPLLRGNEADFLRQVYHTFIAPISRAEADEASNLLSMEKKILDDMLTNLQMQEGICESLALVDIPQTSSSTYQDIKLNDSTTYFSRLQELMKEHEKMKILICSDKRVKDSILGAVEAHVSKIRLIEVSKKEKFRAAIRASWWGMSSVILITLATWIFGSNMTRREAENVYSKVSGASPQRIIELINNDANFRDLPLDVKKDIVEKIREEQSRLATGEISFERFMDISVEMYTQKVMQFFRQSIEELNKEGKDVSMFDEAMIKKIEKEMRTIVKSKLPSILAKVKQLRSETENPNKTGWSKFVEWLKRTGAGPTYVNQTEQDIKKEAVDIIEDGWEQMKVAFKDMIGTLLAGEGRGLWRSIVDLISPMLGAILLIALVCGLASRFLGVKVRKPWDLFVAYPFTYPFKKNGMRSDLEKLLKSYIAVLSEDAKTIRLK